MEITKELLEEKYNSMTNEALCKELEISAPTLLRYLEKFNIPLKGRGNKEKIRVV